MFYEFTAFDTGLPLLVHIDQIVSVQPDAQSDHFSAIALAGAPDDLIKVNDVYAEIVRVLNGAGKCLSPVTMHGVSVSDHPLPS